SPMYLLVPYTTLFRSPMDSICDKARRACEWASLAQHLVYAGRTHASTSAGVPLVIPTSVAELRFLSDRALGLLRRGLASLRTRRSEEHTSELQSRENL